MSDLSIREADGWFEIDLRPWPLSSTNVEPVPTEVLDQPATWQSEAGSMDLRRLIEALYQRGILSMPAKRAFDRDDDWTRLFDDFYVVRVYDDMLGWVPRAWVHLLPIARRP